jgi:hypothetical protein
MTDNMLSQSVSGMGPGRLARYYDERPAPPPEEHDPQPRRPDWLVILMIGLFVLTLLIAWFSDVHLLIH